MVKKKCSKVAQEKTILFKQQLFFPGWFVKDKENQNSTNIWVLNPKALPKFISNTKESLNQEDMMLASYHISRFIRTNTL